MSSAIRTLLSSAKTLLFDYDGVIVNSEPLYLETWKSLLDTTGGELCARIHEGKHESEVFSIVRDYLIDPGLSLDQVSELRRAKFEMLVLEGRLQPVEGIVKVILEHFRVRELHLVSNSSSDVVTNGLRAIGQTSHFCRIFCAGVGQPRKPSPFLYLYALGVLGFSERDVVAIEDSRTGIESALAARIPIIGLSSKAAVRAFCRAHDVPCAESAEELLLVP